MNNENQQFFRGGILFVVSAPSGAGKTTLCDSLRLKPDFVYSVSTTTRAPRPGEIDGEDYHFVSKETFLEMIEKDAFLEYAEVHGNLYGTSKQTVLDNLNNGIDVLIDIDIQGAELIRRCKDSIIQSALVDIFIMPPNLAELRRRLIKRGTETEEQINIRIQNAATEMQHWQDYKYTIISGSMEEDIEKFRAVMRAERYASARMSQLPKKP
ncbi:MAG: guanylate kinase [Chthoniobacterales bacterium]